MPTELEKLSVLIEANTKSYERAMVRLERKTDKALKASSRSFRILDRKLKETQKIGVAFSRAFLVGFGVGGASGLAVAAKQSLEFGNALQDTADKLGLTAEALQEFRFAAELTGVSGRTLDMALQRFTRRLGEAQQGTGELKGIIEQYGIALRNSQGETRSTEEVLGDLADRIAQTTDAQERLRIAFKAFDSEGAALVNLLRRGRAGLAEFRQEARDAGGVLSDEMTKKLADANTQFVKLGAVLNVKVAEGVGKVAELLEKIDSLRKAPPPAMFLEQDMNRIPGFPEPVSNAAKKGDNLSIRPSPIPPVSDEAIQSLERWQAAVEPNLDLLEQVERQFQQIEDRARVVTDNMGDAFNDFVESGKLSFADFADSLAKDLAKLTIRQAVLQPLTSAITGALGGNALPFAGFRADGGPVVPGRAFVVGEEGPELFVPNRSGHIVPSGHGRGQPAPTVVNVINQGGGAVQTREGRTTQGGRQIDVIIGEMAGEAMERHGSRANQAIRRLGGRPPLISR